jgi:hypothetical protein
VSLQERAKEILGAFAAGRKGKEACMSLFEALLRQHGMLPPGGRLDRSMPGADFMSLLMAARDRKDEPPYRLADSIARRCPVCGRKASGLFGRLREPGGRETPVDPPRCRECMLGWVERRGASARQPEPALPFTPDTTAGIPMSPDELDFFQQYEKEMEGQG